MKRILILFSMICFCALTISAQEAATVKSFAQTTDHIPGKDRRNDLNGAPCALIKVYVVDDIERIEGNKIGDVVKKGNVEKWVYMCKGSRNIRLHLKNHLPVRVMFQDYHINGLESNRVYELTIHIPTSENTSDETISKQPINQTPDNYAAQQPIEKGKRALNYKFDYSKMKIDGAIPQDYLMRNGRENKYNHFDSYQDFIEELERTFVRTANEELSDYNGYKLTNSDNLEYEVIISLQEMDEDGEHNVRGMVCHKGNGQEISSFTIHVGSGSNNFFKGFDKQIKKSGKRFAEGLIDKVLEKFPLYQSSDNQQQKDSTYSHLPRDQKQEVQANADWRKNEDDQLDHPSPTVSQSLQTITPKRPLNKSFKVLYEGVTFKCKAKKGYITITGFDTGAENVTIPGKVEFEGDYYIVREIDTFINGNNYAATKIVIEEGVEQIASFAFVEFRKLVDVTIPSTIKEIGKNAFRDNSGMRFNAPSNISEYDLRGGRAIRVR